MQTGGKVRVLSVVEQIQNFAFLQKFLYSDVKFDHTMAYFFGRWISYIYRTDQVLSQFCPRHNCKCFYQAL